MVTFGGFWADKGVVELVARSDGSGFHACVGGGVVSAEMRECSR